MKKPPSNFGTESLALRANLGMVVCVGVYGSCLSVMWNLLTCVLAVYSLQHLAQHSYTTLAYSEVGSKAYE